MSTKRFLTPTRMAKTRKGSGRRKQTRRMRKGTRRMRGGEGTNGDPSSPVPSVASNENDPSSMSMNLGTKFLKEKTDELYAKARVAYVVKDLIAALHAKRGCTGSTQIVMSDPEGLKRPILQEISDAYEGKTQRRLFGLMAPKERNVAVKQAVDSVLKGTSMECRLIPEAIKKLQRFYPVLLPGETMLSPEEEYNAPLRSLSFLQSGEPAYAEYKNVPANILKQMLRGEKGEGSTLDGYVEALKTAPELGLTATQLKKEFAKFVDKSYEKASRLRENHAMYVRFLKDLKAIQAQGIPIEKDYVIEIATSLDRETLKDILARILAYAKRAKWISKGENPNLMKWLEEAKPNILSAIQSAQEKGIAPEGTSSFLVQLSSSLA